MLMPEVRRQQSPGVRLVVRVVHTEAGEERDPRIMRVLDQQGQVVDALLIERVRQVGGRPAEMRVGVGPAPIVKAIDRLQNS